MRVRVCIVSGRSTGKSMDTLKRILYTRIMIHNRRDCPPTPVTRTRGVVDVHINFGRVFFFFLCGAIFFVINF